MSAKSSIERCVEVVVSAIYRCCAVAAAVVIACGSAGASPATADPYSPAEAAIARIADGDYGAAERRTAAALASMPSDPLLHDLAGAILLAGGEPSAALRHFQTAIAVDGSDALARYGAGLALLDTGSEGAALRSFDRSEALGGDRSYLWLAREYAEWVSGAQLRVEGAGVPDAFQPALHAIQGMSALRRADLAAAERDLIEAQAAIPGDPILQPAGVLMTFRVDRSIAGSAEGVGHLLALAGTHGAHASSGVVALGATALPAGAAYVGYEVDGRPVGLVNEAPYSFAWDSRDAANGQHTVSVVAYDAAGREITRANRHVVTFNLPPAGDERVDRVRGALWQALTLRPDRCTCACAVGHILRVSGHVREARTWLTRALAVDPGYAAARRELQLCGGLKPGGDAVWGGLQDRKVVALSFDDGPKPGLTEPLLDILAREKVTGTFFVIGRHVTEYPDLTRRIVRAGMEIANHSYTHRNLTHLDRADVEREVLETQAAVEMVTGITPRLMRPPGGDWNDTCASLVRADGLTPCFWTVDAFGSEEIGAQAVADTVLSRAQPGSIILMHNGKVSTIEALPTIIHELRKRGYGFVSVSDLAARWSAARASARLAAERAAMANAHRADE